VTKRRHPTNALYVHPQDMEEIALKNGDAARISNRHGSIIGYVRSDSSMRRGVVSMTHCWGVSDSSEDPKGLKGAHTGRLVSIAQSDVEAIDGMPWQSAIPVSVERAMFSQKNGE
jgi:anaerobic selenocysteine-containing dehydrogenase